MTTQTALPVIEFEQQLQTLKAYRDEHLPPELLTSILADIVSLAQSGIVERSLKAGAHAPDFTLTDSAGQSWALADMLARGPVVLLFYRGEWCPFCNLTLRAYQLLLPQIHALGATLLAISPQRPEHAQNMIAQHGITFPMLVDEGNAVGRRYGLIYAVSETLNQINAQLGVNLGSYIGDEPWELPIPGTFLVDQQGTIRLAFADPDFTRRLEPRILLDHLRSVQCAASDTKLGVDTRAVPG